VNVLGTVFGLNDPLTVDIEDGPAEKRGVGVTTSGACVVSGCGVGKTGEVNGAKLGTANENDVGSALNGFDVGGDVGGNANADIVGDMGTSTGVGGNASTDGDGNTAVCVTACGGTGNAMPVEDVPTPTPDMDCALAVPVNASKPPAATAIMLSVLSVIMIAPR
jgi:hypothetical protein